VAQRRAKEISQVIRVSGNATVIRPATEAERLAIAELYWTVWRETQAPLQPAEVSALRDRHFFVARVLNFPTPPLAAFVADELAGFAACQGAYLGQLYLGPRARGLGLGRALLAASEAAMRAAGHRLATLRCLVGNPARSFYERNGWSLDREATEMVETRSGACPVSSWLMVKRLDATSEAG
jgi:GNAT superfamily N-acetyltransferase